MILLEKFFENKTHVIWDWNGTLLNDVILCASITSEIMAEHGLAVPSLDHHRKSFRLPIRSYYDDLGFMLTDEEFSLVAHDFQARYLNRVHECGLFEGALELLEILKRKSKSLAVLSAANETDLKVLLDRFNISHHFDHICGLSDVFAVSKIERGRELIDRWKVSSEQIVMVGDMDHDVEVAQALGIDVLVLGDGHQHVDRLTAIHRNVITSRYEVETVAIK